MDMLFISSTFQDMQYERDAIRDFVIPRLNIEAYEYGQSVSICDLRWGINTADLDSDTAALKILDICLDEIDKSRSPMIVILGERYGWIPPENLIDSVARRKNLQLEDLRLSATALEIEYGTLVHADNVLFYFRELEGTVLEKKYLEEDEDCRRKMEDLKSKIMRLPNGKVRKYRVRSDGEGICQEDINRFAAIVYEDIRHVLLQEWQDLPVQTPFGKERRSHWTYIKEKSSFFLAREAQANLIIQSVLDGQGRIVITGEPGSGKSTLFCKIADVLKEKGLCVIPFVGGLTADSSTSMGILRQLVYCLEEELGMEHIQDIFAGEKEKLRARLSELCLSFQNRSQPLVIMIDAVDQLLADSDKEKMIFIPNCMASNVHVVISCIPGIKVENGKNFYLLPIDQADKELAIWRILQRHHKELAESVKEDLMAHPSSGNPLFLNLLLQRLIIMNRWDFGIMEQRRNGIKRISDYQKGMIDKAGGTLEEMSISLFKEVGERVNPGLVSKVIEYMALSRYGLRDGDFALLLGEEWNYLDFIRMIHYIEESFLHREDGRYDFVHQSIRNGALRECKNRKGLHKDIFQVLQKLDEKDPVRISEIVYHGIKADDKRFIVGYIEKHKDDNLILKDAAKCIYYLCIVDEGRWICELLSNAEKYHAGLELAVFLNDYCIELFGENYNESIIKLRILKQLDLYISKFQDKKDIEWQNLFMHNSYKVAFVAKFTGDSSLEEYTEKYLAVSKEFYQKGFIDKRQLFMVYNNVVCFYKGSSKRSLLRRGLELAKEGIDIGLCNLLADEKEVPIWFYGSMGEIYHRLQEPENALAAYERDLENRKKWADKYPSEYSMTILSGAYYNVGNALSKLGNYKGALPYYEKALELFKYRDIELDENVVADEENSKRYQLGEKINLYNNYAETLWEVGCEDDREDYISCAFFYKKETLKMDRSYRHLTQMEYNFNRDIVKLAHMAYYMSEMNRNLSEIYLKDFFELVDSFLTEDENLYRIDNSLDNMWMLKDEYIGVFHAIRQLNLPDVILYLYKCRCYNALIVPINENIILKKSGSDISSHLNIVIGYYNKSALLYDLGESSFYEEALESSLKAMQELEWLVDKGIYNELTLIKQKAVCAYQAGRCYIRVNDRHSALAYFQEAVEKQAMIAFATSDVKEKEVLEEYKKGCARYRNMTVSQELNDALFNPSLTAKMKEVFDKKMEEKLEKFSGTYYGDRKNGHMHGKGTMNYADGSIYTGEWINGKRSGVGKLTWMSGEGEYYGQWKNDLKEGYGEAVFPSGSSYRGEWKEGKPHGYGIKIDAKGEENCGIWQEGNLYKKLSKIKVMFALGKYSKILI